MQVQTSRPGKVDDYRNHGGGKGDIIHYSRGKGGYPEDNGYHQNQAAPGDMADILASISSTPVSSRPPTQINKPDKEEQRAPVYPVNNVPGFPACRQQGEKGGNNADEGHG